MLRIRYVQRTRYALRGERGFGSYRICAGKYIESAKADISICVSKISTRTRRSGVGCFLRRWWTFVFVESNQFRGHCIVRSVQMSVRCIQKCDFTKIKIEIPIVFMYNDRVVVLTRPPKDIHGRYAFPKGVFNHVYR